MIPASKKGLWWLAAAFVSVIILIVLFRRFDFGAVLACIGGAWKFPLFLALIYTVVANLILSAWQWRVVYAEMGHKIPLAEHIFVKASIYPLRMAAPFRAGDLGRPIYMSRAHRIPIAKSIAAAALVLVVNIAILLVLSVIGFLVAGYALFATFSMAAFGLLTAGVMYVRTTLLERGSEAPGWLTDRIEEAKWIANIPTEEFLPIVLLGVVTILTQVMEFALIASAFDIHLTPQAAFSVVPVIMLAGSLPISLMGIGVREAATLFLLAGYARPEKLLSASLVFTMTDQILLAFIGLATLVPFIYACRKPDWPTVREG